MLLTAEQINNIITGQPLVGRAAPNFRSKKDKKTVKPFKRKKEEDTPGEHPQPRSEGEELDCYV